ncbi:MAG: sulfotransferase [Pseudomonadota bacterium]
MSGAAEAGRRPAAGAFAVSAWMHLLSGLVERYPRFWIRLGRLETALLRERLEAIEIRAPIYVAGLARSGSTMLLEVLARHPDCASHRYEDFPLIHVPWLWQQFLRRAPRRPAAARERAHADGILITPQSPEAFEEVIWMAFFPWLHDPGQNAWLGADFSAAEFEQYYRMHLRKLLLGRGATRYLAKANYQVTRLEYLLRLFPDARFVVPVRDPEWHIASLVRQHRRFCAIGRAAPRALAHLRRAGHFEFGLDRRAINPGDAATTRDIMALWAGGEEIAGWARYWALVHGAVASALADNPALRAATLVVRHEDLCRVPEETLRRLFHHCRLPGAEALIATCAPQLGFPTYYRPQFGAGERALIAAATGPARRRLEAFIPT